MANQKMSESQYYGLIETINSDCVFYEKKDKILKYSDVEKQLKNRGDSHPDKFLSDYFISIWIHGNSEDKFYDEFIEYISGKKECIAVIERELAQFKIDRFWIEYGLSSAEYQLHELGYFGEKNKFRNCSLENIIRKGAVEGSFEAVTLAASYLKLANYENRDIDIESLVYAWTVYYQCKDYSVYTIDNALIVFEKEKLIDEDESFKIISRLMEQSEKGIFHLLTSYVNQKDDLYIKKLIKRRYFSDSNNAIRFWELDSALLDCFDKADMSKQLTELLRSHYYSKNIEFRDLATAMQSKYKDRIQMLEMCGCGYYWHSPEYYEISVYNNYMGIIEKYEYELECCEQYGDQWYIEEIRAKQDFELAMYWARVRRNRFGFVIIHAVGMPGARMYGRHEEELFYQIIWKERGMEQYIPDEIPRDE